MVSTVAALAIAGSAYKLMPWSGHLWAAGMVVLGTAAVSLAARWELRNSEFYSTITSASLSWGALGTVMLIIHALRNLTSAAGIAAGMGKGLLPFAYASGLAILLLILRSSLAEPDEHVSMTAALWPLCVVGAVLLIVMAFLSLVLVFATAQT